MFEAFDVLDTEFKEVKNQLTDETVSHQTTRTLLAKGKNSKRDMKKGRFLSAAHDVKESVPLPATLLSQSSLEQVSIDSKEADGHCRENRSEFDSRFMGMLLTIQADFSAKLAAQKEEFQADFSAKLAAQKVVSAAQKEELVAQISQLNNRVVSLELTIRPIFLRKLATNARELVWKEAGRDPLYPFTYIEFCALNASEFTSKGSKYYDDVVKPLKELKLVIDAGNTIAHQIAPSDAQLCADELTSMPEGVHRAVLELFYMHFFGHSANEQLVQGAR